MSDSSPYDKAVHAAQVLFGLGLVVRGVSNYRKASTLGYMAAPSAQGSRLPEFSPDKGAIVSKATIKQVANIDQRVSYIQDRIEKDSKSPVIKEYALGALTKRCGSRYCVDEKDYDSEIKALFDGIRDPNSPFALRYTKDHPTTDQFTSAEKLIQLGGGDCFVKGTHVLAAKGLQLVPIETVVVGDLIWGLDRWSQVVNTWDKGVLGTWRIDLNNGSSMRLTPNHKVYAQDESGEVRRIYVSDLQVGTMLVRPHERMPGGNTRREKALSVQAIVKDDAPRECVDIATDDHYVYLPEADCTVSNCDDACILLGSLLMSVGFFVKLRVVQSTNSDSWDHIYLLCINPETGKVVPLDTTVKHAYPGWQVPGADAVAKTRRPAGMVVKVKDFDVPRRK